MKIDHIKIDNLKCGGCANTISRKLRAIADVKTVEINPENAMVTIVYQSEKDLHEQFIEILARAGYPAAGTSTKFQKAKSYVSCATGRLSKIKT